LFGDANASRYLAGLAVHWYADDVNYPASISVNYSGAILADIHHKYPDKFILGTEVNLKKNNIISITFRHAMDLSISMEQNLEHGIEQNIMLMILFRY
jgi:hypothetical protein